MLHHIQTTGPPLASKFRRLDGVKLAAAKAEFLQLEKEGVVQRSSSPWSSPLHMVKKADGSWRPCGDYRRLNMVTVPDAYPLPNMLDFQQHAAGCTVFSKIDLRKGYHQVPVAPEDVQKTAIATPFGLFEYRRMPFGLRNAGNTFQRHMDRAMAELKGCFVYLDDILVASRTDEEHAQQLHHVFQRLRQQGLVINAAKCCFGVSTLDFLGHRVSAAGVVPLPSYVEAVTNFPPPSTVKQLQQFLGLVNFYRRFLPGAAETLRPLTSCLKGLHKGTDPLDWSDDMAGSFQRIKSALAAAARLAHPADGAKISLAVDASATHIGAALQQKRAGQAAWEPLGFFSKKLSPAQVKYSAFDRELLACAAGIRHFRFLLEGRDFMVLTDHKPLTHAINRTSDPWTPRQCRQLAYVAEYTSDIRHIKGASNVVADTLSRPPPPSQPALPSSSPARLHPEAAHEAPAAGCGPTGVLPHKSIVAAVLPLPIVPDAAQLAADQLLCPETLATAASSSLSVRSVAVGDTKLLCDDSRGVNRPLVPAAHRRRIFEAAHSLAHPGIRASQRLISARWVWKGSAADVARWCRDCQQCQRGKVTKQPAAAVQPIAVPERRFSHLHVDLVGPLPTSQDGYRYLLTAIDRSTRWLEAVPLKDMETASCTEALAAQWIARFGVPAAVTTDRGAQFTSAAWATWCTGLGVDHIKTTSYHPQSNGMVERSHRQLKDALRSRLATNDWPLHLPWVLLGLRAAPKEDCNLSSAELVFGSPLSLPGQLLTSPEPPVADFLRRLRNQPPPPPTRPLSYAAVASTPPASLMSARYVYVRRGGLIPPLSPLYVGPYAVLAAGGKFFKLAVGDKTETVSIDRLKPHLGLSPLVPATPAARGRPTRAGP